MLLGGCGCAGGAGGRAGGVPAEAELRRLCVFWEGEPRHVPDGRGPGGPGGQGLTLGQGSSTYGSKHLLKIGTRQNFEIDHCCFARVCKLEWFQALVATRDVGFRFNRSIRSMIAASCLNAHQKKN